MSKFLTINKAAAHPDCPLRAGTLRAMVKRGEVPGFRSGNRFYVDLDGLLEMLEQRRRAVIKPDVAAN